VNVKFYTVSTPTPIQAGKNARPIVGDCMAHQAQKWYNKQEPLTIKSDNKELSEELALWGFS